MAGFLVHLEVFVEWSMVSKDPVTSVNVTSQRENRFDPAPSKKLLYKNED